MFCPFAIEASSNTSREASHHKRERSALAMKGADGAHLSLELALAIAARAELCLDARELSLRALLSYLRTDLRRRLNCYADD
eukprot:1528842-Pleurochrysis_carterae.AAC.2